MSRDDWYRRTTWTPDDQREFHDRNRRSRGTDSKAQYIRIQAWTLFETGDGSLINDALELLEQSFVDYPASFDCALSFETAGRCCEALNRIGEAISYYQKALARQKEFPGVVTNACFSLGKLAVEQERSDLYDTVLSALDDFGHLMLPWQAYMAYGIRAVIALSNGDDALARSYADRAFDAAAVRDSGLGWGRAKVGIVKDTNTRMHSRLLTIAGT